MIQILDSNQALGHEMEKLEGLYISPDMTNSTYSKAGKSETLVHF
jgi:hypothetical protein